jgi:hypothetical protein
VAQRYHLSTLRREVDRLKSGIEADNAPIVLNLSNGETYSIRSKSICKFGAAAIFDEGSPECKAVKQAVEPTNKMIKLLQMVLN